MGAIKSLDIDKPIGHLLKNGGQGSQITSHLLILKHMVNLVNSLEEETGVNPGWINNGNLILHLYLRFL